MDLEINYKHGSMIIHLENFLNCRNISKVKKLVKIIRNSFTPECEQQIREYIEQELEQFECKQQENHRYIIGYTEKIEFCQRQLENALHNRDQYKRSTPKHKSDGWEHYNAYVKQFRQEMREIKSLLHEKQSDFNENLRNKKFYEKVLENIE